MEALAPRLPLGYYRLTLSGRQMKPFRRPGSAVNETDLQELAEPRRYT